MCVWSWGRVWGGCICLHVSNRPPHIVIYWKGDLNIEDVFNAVWSLRGTRWLTLVNLTLLVKWSLRCLVTCQGKQRERWRDWERQSETACQEMTGRRVDGVLSWDLRRSFLDLLPSKSEKCHWKLWSLSLKTETLCKCLLQL